MFIPLCVLISLIVCDIGGAFEVPTIVRSPFLNEWTASDRVSQFSSGGSFTWTGLISVDNVTYVWWGDTLDSVAHKKTNLFDVQVTPTRTIYIMQAGLVNLNVTAFSPIEPTDLLRQSLPFAYLSLSLTLTATTEIDTNVSIYTYIDGDWTGNIEGVTSTGEVWRTVYLGDNVYHHCQFLNTTSTPEFGDQLNGGLTNVVYGMSLNTPGHITQCSGSSDCYDQWLATGRLYECNSSMSNPTVSAPGVLSPSGNQVLTLLWTLGMMRDPAITYTTPNGASQHRSPYFKSQYSNISSIVAFVLKDFDNATKRADDLVSLSTRAVMGSTELAISNGSDGNFNTSDVKLFMMDIGTSDRVNPISTLYAAFPFFLYVNPMYLGYLLEPLFEYQSSPQYPLPYAAVDVGLQYPNATGDNQPHNQGLDESGNMLIMSLAHARAANDTTLLVAYYDLLKSWTEFIATYALTPPQGNASPNSTTTLVQSTNLALKGVLSIQAMSEISHMLGQMDDSKRYSERASNDARVWSTVALASDKSHVLSNYGDSDSHWALIYNLYADRLLGMDLVNDSVYDLQSTYLKNMTYGTKSPFYGVPMDDTSDVGDAAWTMFTAAVVTDSIVRDVLLTALWTRLNATGSGPNLYNTTTGTSVSNNGEMGPANGAAFALLALTIPGLSVAASNSGNGNGSNSLSSQPHSLVGPVVGGVLGCRTFCASSHWLLLPEASSTTRDATIQFEPIRQ
ncbi:unnamed protein product [Somion occarium]|uniref:Glutaminase A central domain-containing protein n=1 Tax=Somion occarium TaxID=3059160 RepID=A0ABP1E378_9APHY